MLRFTARKGASALNLSRKQFVDIHVRSFFPTSEPEPVPSEARVVIAGGGVVGCSVAYHLAKAGWKNIVLLERETLGCGSTWASAGMTSILYSTTSEIAINAYSAQLYKKLHEQGYDIGYKPVGSINLARVNDRATCYKRNLLVAERFKIEGAFLSQSEIKKRYPMLNTTDILGGMWIPGDMIVDGVKLTTTLATLAKEEGVAVYENCPVSKVLTAQNRDVLGVETPLGSIECGYFVNCTGMWGRSVGKLSRPSVRVPLHACEHGCIISKPIDGIPENLPIVRDYDGFVYLREYNGGILGGGFEPIAKPVFYEGIPKDFACQLLPEDWDQFQPNLEQLIHRLPDLATVEVLQLTNAPESFTPDCRYVMGKIPEASNYYVAAGMNGSGLSAAGGVGHYLAEWMMEGEPSVSMWTVDIMRFAELHNNRRFLKDRVTESLSMVAHIPYWEADMIGYDSGRRLRTSAIFTRNEPFAVFGQSMGYERPLYFHSESHVDDEADSVWMPKPVISLHGIKTYELNKTGLPQKGTFGKPSWFEKVRSEYWACRTGVCLIDMSTFAKFELRSGGDEVTKFLQQVCSNDIDKVVGTIVHTGMLNDKGGFENDCSVVRLQPNRYFIIGPTAQQIRSFAWLRQHLPKDGSVQLSDVTSMYTAINVIGPKAQELLSELTPTDMPLDKQSFPHMTCKEIHIGMASHVKAMRLTHTGEEGFVLYIPSEYALHVYDTLMMYGKNYGIRSAGYYALRALRTEKFFAYWGTDLMPNVTPLECGREMRVKMDVGGFIGYPALVKQRAEGIRKRLVQLALVERELDASCWPWGKEPIYRNGKYCGLTTSTAYGFSLDRHLCLGYVHDFDDKSGEANVITSDFVIKSGAKYEVNIAGKLYTAKPHIYPLKLPEPGSIKSSVGHDTRMM